MNSFPVDKEDVKEENGEDKVNAAAVCNASSSDNFDYYHSIGVQCGTDGLSVSCEDSNLVLKKSWSDCEEDAHDLSSSKKLRRREKRELKRKASEEAVEDQTKRVKIEVNGSTAVSESPNTDAASSNISEAKSANQEKGTSSNETTVNMKKKFELNQHGVKNVRPGYSDDRFSETSYYFEGGLRKVYPYYFTFTTYAKGRWVGEKILDVFSREFRAHPAEEYRQCIEAGSLTVNYEKVDVDYELKHNDLLANIVHRHEVPVSASPIEVIHLDKDIVVINKPASVPVHPCGRYRHNTIVFILAKEYNLKNLRTIHRLDRLTSGVLMFGRTVRKALELEQQIRDRIVSKAYICRVEGDFPYNEIECKEPIEVVSYKIGVCKVSAKGKECSTTFEKVGYNPKTNTSVVKCKPHTGRMHQIRVHLQFLGYPVLRDPLYNHPVFGPEKGKEGRIGKTDEELIKDLINIHNAENWLGMDGEVSQPIMAPISDSFLEEDADIGGCEDVTPLVKVEDLPYKSVSTQTNYEEPDPHFRKEKLTREERCSECKVRFRDPKPKDLVMYLHAFRYQGPKWSYQTSLPPWADVNWCED